MKAITFRETSKGSKIAIAVSEASLDPLETDNAAIAFAQDQPKFKELQARIGTYNDFLETCRADGIKFKDASLVPPKVKAELRLRLQVISEYQDDLMQIRRDRAAADPVHFLPASGVLVSDEDFALMEADIAAEKVIEISVNPDGTYIGYTVIDSKIGTKYRLRNSREWITVSEPDEGIPDDAVYTDPDEGEMKRIEVSRISNRDADQRAAEKQILIEQAQKVFAQAVTVADLAGDPDAIQQAKDQARTDYDNTAAEIELLYG